MFSKNREIFIYKLFRTDRQAGLSEPFVRPASRSDESYLYLLIVYNYFA